MFCTLSAWLRRFVEILRLVRRLPELCRFWLGMISTMHDAPRPYDPPAWS